MRMEMALGNLLDNAIKFTSPGGVVTLTGESQDGFIRIRVEDTGTGILPEDLPFVFERFYRGHSPQAEGSGLGLAIVQSIVQAHGGQVTVESQAGQGSRFILLFQTPAAGSLEIPATKSLPVSPSATS
jgi:signal transduction histidine kinase